MPVIHSCPQRSREWFTLRCGIPTASAFDKVLTAGGKPSRQRDQFMNALLAEWMLGYPLEGPETQWMVRGRELEDDAVKAYTFITGRETLEVGFITNSEATFGASPDRLIGDTGLLEIKCPSPAVHVSYLLQNNKLSDSDYGPQLQGELMVSEREWVDIVSYHPEMPPVVVRVVRDEKYIAALRLALELFVSEMLEKREELERRFGPFVRTQDAEDPEPPNGLTDSDVEEYIAHLNATDGWANDN